MSKTTPSHPPSIAGFEMNNTKAKNPLVLIFFHSQYLVHCSYAQPSVDIQTTTFNSSTRTKKVECTSISYGGHGVRVCGWRGGQPQAARWTREAGRTLREQNRLGGFMGGQQKKTSITHTAQTLPRSPDRRTVTHENKIQWPTL